MVHCSPPRVCVDIMSIENTQTQLIPETKIGGKPRGKLPKLNRQSTSPIYLYDTDSD